MLSGYCDITKLIEKAYTNLGNTVDGIYKEALLYTTKPAVCFISAYNVTVHATTMVGNSGEHDFVGFIAHVGSDVVTIFIRDDDVIGLAP